MEIWSKLPNECIKHIFLYDDRFYRDSKSGLFVGCISKNDVRYKLIDSIPRFRNTYLDFLRTLSPEMIQIFSRYSRYSNQSLEVQFTNQRYKLLKEGNIVYQFYNNEMLYEQTKSKFLKRTFDCFIMACCIINSRQ